MKQSLSLMAAALLAAALPSHAADLVVVGHPSAAPISKDQAADIFLGKNLDLKPVLQPEGSPIHAEFYKKATGRDVAQAKAVWSRLTFTGKAAAPKELPDSAAVKKAVAADPKTIGYIEKAAVDGSVKVLTAIE